jgi:hypothetical protein
MDLIFPLGVAISVLRVNRGGGHPPGTMIVGIT